MLILNRKAGQSLLIANRIKIILLSGIGDIRVGIEAPKDMQILRTEILHRYRFSKKSNRQISNDEEDSHAGTYVI